MSYEGDLATHYNSIRQKLIGSPPIDPIVPSFPRQPLASKNELQALLLRIQALETRILELEASKIRGVNPENIIINYPLYTQATHGFLAEIFKLIRNNEQNLDPSADLRPCTIFGPSRQKDVSHVRHIMYYLMSKMTDRSLPEIGRFLKRDHTSVLHGKRRIENQIKNNPMMEIKMNWYRVEIARMLAVRCGKPVNDGDTIKNNGDSTPVVVEAV
jgi:DnaA-like protein